MKRKKLIIVGFLILIAAGLIYYFGWFGREEEAAGIETSGHIEVTEVDLSFRISGHLAVLTAEEGRQVKKGDLLAELKREVLQARRDQAAAQVEELEARCASLAMSIDIREEVLEAQIKQAEAGVSAAKARFVSLKKGSREEEIREAAAARDRAKTEWENRERDHQRMKSLYERQIVPASQFDDARTAAESAKAAYLAAEERFQLVKAGPRQEMVWEGRANLSGSDAALEAARAGLREVAKMKLDLKALQGQLAQAQALLTLAEEDLADARLYVPFNGFITVKNVEESEFVQAGSPVATLAQLDEVWVRTYVPETQLGLVRLGQKAEVTADSFPGKVYPGRVTYISPKAEFTPKNVQTKEERVKLVYRIKVSLANPDQELKAGMPVDVRLR